LSTRTKILAAVAALAVLVIALSRGGAPSPEVRQLEDDPIASYVPPGGTLVDSDSRDAGTSLGRPVPAQVTRLFQLAAGQGQRALADAGDEAEASGWTTVGTPTDRALVARKELPEGRAELTVTLVNDARLLPNDAKPPALSVSLRQLGQ
jgi:hypothetical protein